MEKIGLTIDEIMWRVFVSIAWFFEGQVTDLNKQIWVEVGSDFDYHTGSMIYEQIIMFGNTKGSNFIGGFGKKCNGYPGERFNSDFLLIKVDEDIKNDELLAEKKVKRSTYFKNSLYVTYKSGSFTIGPNISLNKDLFCENNLNRYIARNMEINPDHFSLSGEPIITNSILFKSDFVDYLVDATLDYIQSL